MAPRIAIVIYTLYGHIAKGLSFASHPSIPYQFVFSVAEAQKRGIEAAGGTATIYQ